MDSRYASEPVLLEVPVAVEVAVRRETCIGCGACVRACPQLFAVAGGTAVVHSVFVPRELEDTCFDAMEDCPSGSVVLAEVQSGPKEISVAHQAFVA
ncbi:ferredoxin [Planctomycetota bacterium]